jgi:regulator of protease activity HflC (stomatin/prohibitin superfamily)
VQFRVIVQYAYAAYYSLNDTKRQIQTYVFDVIRSAIPRMSLDQIFASKTEISDTVFSRLQSMMKVYGYEIVSTLLGKISPNELVRFSMNEINVSRRMKEAAPHRAEGG